MADDPHDDIPPLINDDHTRAIVRDEMKKAITEKIDETIKKFLVSLTTSAITSITKAKAKEQQDV